MVLEKGGHGIDLGVGLDSETPGPDGVSGFTKEVTGGLRTDALCPGNFSFLISGEGIASIGRLARRPQGTVAQDCFWVFR